MEFVVLSVFSAPPCLFICCCYVRKQYYVMLDGKMYNMEQGIPVLFVFSIATDITMLFLQILLLLL